MEVYQPVTGDDSDLKDAPRLFVEADARSGQSLELWLSAIFAKLLW